ncbi:ABC transporter ATP-binding protein [Candidatus Uhrbacteria bacterium]|nr:ABC transporter ATP-binding protein [Candidatus Uhrbacteria bacterium]
MSSIVFSNVSQTYHSPSDESHDTVALKNVSFTIGDQEFVGIVGPSGCGKTTILNLIAGFLQPSTGEIRLEGARCGYVFQKNNLFPWKTVRQNIEFGLQMNGVAKLQQQTIVDEYLRQMRLEGFADQYPHELSIGMQQRAGLARAYAAQPDTLLMDEPFVSIDAQMRLHMHELLLDIWTKQKKTVVFVTHDIDEAILLPDRVFVFSGRPGMIKEEIPVTLPRPRSHHSLNDPHYGVLRKQMIDALFEKTEDKTLSRQE